jgi:ABC-2 type transport system ATP-binding protein
LLEPTLGSVRLNRRASADDPVAFRRQLGYVPEEPYLYTHLTAFEYLRLVGRLRNIDETRLNSLIGDLLELLDLTHARGALLATYSKGMRQRVLLAAALLHEPALLILDEPFSGLDVNASLLLVAVLQELARRGKMILLSSHRMDLVETLCARVVILHRGRIVAQGTPEELRTRRHSESLDEVFALVTEQEDYAARARELLDIVQRS